MVAARWAAVMVVVAAAIRVPTLALPLTEAHSFRQAQTAFPAVIYAIEGIDLLRPQVPVFGPPWVLPFEFPLFQAAAAILMRQGVPMELALRGLSLVAFLATGVVLWFLLSRHVGQRAALIALAAFLFSPFSLLWARTSMIEYPAALAAVLFTWGVLEWHTGQGGRWFVLALLSGACVSLLKITTAVFWVLPALLTRRQAALALGTVSLAAGALWTRYADSIKETNEYSAFLVSSRLIDWTVGGNRLDPQTWRFLIDVIPQVTGLLLLPFALAVVLRSERHVWIWMLIAAVGPLLLFTNLYGEHDYYLAAITPSVAALIGGGIDEALRRVPPAWVRPVGVFALSIGTITVVGSARYWLPAYLGGDPDGVMAQVAAITAQSDPNHVIILRRDDWSPAAFLYSGRRGYALQSDVPAHQVAPEEAVEVLLP